MKNYMCRHSQVENSLQLYNNTIQYMFVFLTQTNWNKETPIVAYIVS